MTRRTSKAQKPDARGGSYFLLPHSVTKSLAWRTASPRALKALLVICSRHTGFNNGSISISQRELAESLDSQNHGANAKAVAELISRGFLAMSKDYPKGHRLAREYRLTFIPTDAPASNEYLEWEPGDAGSRRKPVVARKKGNFSHAVSATERGLSAVVSATETQVSAAVSTTASLPINGKQPFSEGRSVAVSTTHIGNHLGCPPAGPKHGEKTAGGPRKSQNGVVITAAAPPEEVKARALGFVARCGRGAQTMLAKAAGIPEPYLSRFLNHDGPISPQRIIALMCAFPRLEEAHRKGLSA